MAGRRITFSHDVVLRLVGLTVIHPIQPLVTHSRPLWDCFIDQSVFVIMIGECIGVLSDCLGTFLLMMWCCIWSRLAVNNPFQPLFTRWRPFQGLFHCPPASMDIMKGEIVRG
jgi:hypothetical protein